MRSGLGALCVSVLVDMFDLGSCAIKRYERRDMHHLKVRRASYVFRRREQMDTSRGGPKFVM